MEIMNEKAITANTPVKVSDGIVIQLETKPGKAKFIILNPGTIRVIM